MRHGGKPLLTPKATSKHFQQVIGNGSVHFNTLELKSVKLRSLLRNLLLEREQSYFK